MKPHLFWIFFFVTLTTNVKYGTSHDDSGELHVKFVQRCLAMTLQLPYQIYVSCEDAFGKFVSSFKGITSENMVAPKEGSLETARYYSDYFDVSLFPNRPTVNNALFWTNTKLLAQRLLAIGVSITTYDSIFGTRIIEDLHTTNEVTNWCSKPDRRVLINCKCLTIQAVYVFWAEAAERLAQIVVGNSFYLTADAYFAKMSIYNEQVLSTLLKKESRCTRITVINIIPKDSIARCGTGKLLNLEKAVKGTLSYSCFDVYGDHYQPSIELIQCISDLIDDLSVGVFKCGSAQICVLYSHFFVREMFVP